MTAASTRAARPGVFECLVAQLPAGLAGFVIDLAFLGGLLAAGVAIHWALFSSFFAGVIAQEIVRAVGRRREDGIGSQGFVTAFLGMIFKASLALGFRGPFILYSISAPLLWPAGTCILAAVALADGCYCAAGYFLNNVAGEKSAVPPAMAIVCTLFFLRLLYIGVPNLMPEEAYYWNYSEHLAWAYRDHPPMVAWLIKLGTLSFGHNEFAVRSGAFLCWIATAFFCFRAARELYGEVAARFAALLVAILPFFFATACVITPDAPLTAGWAACLYFLQRALIGGREKAWIGAGIALGFGMLSKYTIVLIGPAALLFMIVDKPSRKWLRGPWPYAAAVIALIFFAPVIYWNARHQWTSFVFQGERRMKKTPKFFLHYVLGATLLLLTPAGAAAALAIFSKNAPSAAEPEPGTDDKKLPGRKRLFAATFTLVPWLVFIILSLRQEVKLNWTGPLWLAAIPPIAALFAVPPGYFRNPFAVWIPAGLRLTGFIMPALYAFGFYCITAGLSQSAALRRIGLPLAWKEMAHAVDSIEKRIKSSLHVDPLIVGMDTNALSSVLAFYDDENDGAKETAGSHLFGRRSLMYSQWFPASEQQGKTMVLVAYDAGDLEKKTLDRYADSLGEITKLDVMKYGHIVGTVWYRVLRGYHFQPKWQDGKRLPNPGNEPATEDSAD